MYRVEALVGGEWKRTPHEPKDTKTGIDVARRVLMETGDHARLVGPFGSIIFDTRFQDGGRKEPEEV